MRTENEFREERERVVLLIQGAESKIDRFARTCADDEWALRDLVANANRLRGRLAGIDWAWGR